MTRSRRAAAPLRPALIAHLGSLGLTQRRSKPDEWDGRCPHPDHDDANPSFSYNAAKDTFCCLGCEWRGSGRELADELGIADESVTELAAPRPARGRSVYEYTDEAGRVLRAKVREDRADGKHCWWEHPDPKGRRGLGSGRLKGKGDAQEVCYNLQAVRAAAGSKAPVFLVEGEKCAACIIGAGYVATTGPDGAATTWDDALGAQLAGCHVIVLPDNDAPGEEVAARAAAAILPHAASLRWLELPSLGPKEDVADWMAAGGTADALLGLATREARVIRSAADIPAPDAAPLTPALSVAELAALVTPPREPIVHPCLYQGEIAALVAFRGVGKTHVVMGLGLHIAADGARSFIGMPVHGAWNVLHVNSELPDALMQQRLALHRRALPNGVTLDPRRWHYLSRQSNPDLFVGDLTTKAMQVGLEHHIAATGAQVLILDSLATLLPGGDNEKEAREWPKAQAWLLAVRDRFNLSIILVHQEGKTEGRGARGTSKFEDVPDTVMWLKTNRAEPTAGARFEVHYTKARNFWGKDAEPFEARFVAEPGDAPRWERLNVKRARVEELRALMADGASQRQAAKALGLSAPYASKLLKRAEEAEAPAERPGMRRRGTAKF